jgi:uncharacterized membrane protein (Fun14 family)
MDTTRFTDGLREMAGWKKALLGLGALLLAGGAVIQGYGLVAGGREAAPKEVASGPKEGGGGDVGKIGHGLLPGEGPTLPGEGPEPEEPRDEAGAPEPALEEWSPAMVKGGLSLFVGFCVGYALRTFAKLAMLVIGLIFLGIFLLSWGGVVQVDWGKLGEGFDSVVAVLQSQFASLKTFLQGSIPSAGLAGLGLVSGFKKK